MPLPADFDAARVRLILRDLERTAGATPDYRPSLRLERSPEAPRGVVRGVATRMGMLRLGLRIAREALDAEAITLIDAVHAGPIVDGRDLGVIEITLADEPFLEPEPGRRGGEPSRWALIAGLFLTMMVMASLIVGFVTIAGLLWQIGRPWLAG